jgi:hypothetical protein
MRTINALLAVFLAGAAGRAQVLAPEEIRDPQLRALQQKYRNELKQIAAAAAAHNFPYHFYFSRKLDLEEKEQKHSDQRAIQFDRYQGRVVVKITGNYFVSYSAELMKREERARLTYESVMLPLLQAAVHALEKEDMPQAFALEISHHVRKKVLAVSSESVENVVLVLPKASAQRLIASSDPAVRQSAVLEGEAFVNAAPISFWPRPEDGGTQEAVVETEPAPPQARQTSVVTATPEPTVSALLMRTTSFSARTAPAPSHDSSPEAIRELQKSYQVTLDKMVQELEAQAKFVPYAPPAFVPFYNGVYLQLSVTTMLSEAAAGSQYRLAALAFDEHVAHLIRPAAGYFQGRGDFDGIDFSATVRAGADGNPMAVEFIFPFKPLVAYTKFDSTGQELIDAGYLLINGERVGLNLQAAEAGPAGR